MVLVSVLCRLAYVNRRMMNIVDFIHSSPNDDTFPHILSHYCNLFGAALGLIQAGLRFFKIPFTLCLATGIIISTQ